MRPKKRIRETAGRFVLLRWKEVSWVSKEVFRETGRIFVGSKEFSFGHLSRAGERTGLFGSVTSRPNEKRVLHAEESMVRSRTELVVLLITRDVGAY